MSQYKSAVRSQQGSDSSPYREKATQLTELFPHLPVDELEILLKEVNGDVQLAAARITDGVLQPWGEVSRKKDKKPSTNHISKAPNPGRGDSRGTRGGRGGRGGARGRGGHPKASGNGHVPQAAASSTWGDFSSDIPEDRVGLTANSSTESHDQQTRIPTSVPGATSGHTLEGGINGNALQTPHFPVTRQPSKTPATSKLSWAQIARPQEKTTIAVPSATLSVSPPVQTTVLPSGLEAEAEEIGWEEPTTMEGPTWDDSKQLSAAETWTDSRLDIINDEAVPVTSESQLEALELAQIAVEPIGDAKQDSPSTSAPLKVTASSPSNRPQPIATPSPKLSSRPAATSHRSSAKYKVTDQPVTLPLSFGVGIEKVGMQFGSLSVGDGGTTENTQHETEPPAAASQPIADPTPPLPPVTAPTTSTSLTSMFQQQHGSTIPQSQQSQALSGVQASISLHQFPQQQQQAPAQQQQQPAPSHNVAQPQSQPIPKLPQQLQQNQSVHSLNQHVLVHLDQTQQPTTHHSPYFRGSETSGASPYFHAPTPPVAQTQETSYGSFGQLSSQGQPSHSSAFGNNDYAYNDRFYESYTAQQQGFTSRNPLGHDDIKVVPGQQSATSTLPPSATQGPQTPASTQQPQSAGGQGPQQTYPPPVPYYFPHAYPQNQYYGSPYSSGYVPQPFVKYPAIFQPGPPGPGSASNPPGKQPGNVGVQPQTPYNGGLYQQAGYDEYQTHHSQHQHQHSHSLGLSQGMSDYGKQLYGAGQGSMQGFMGLGGQSGSGGAGPANALPRASPETSYKPYAKDVNVSRSVQGQQGQVPSQPQVQGPNGQGSTGQGFYGGNRFGGGVTSSSSGPQPGGQQAHLGYPQGVNEQNFYGYQPRQQQGYWQ